MFDDNLHSLKLSDDGTYTAYSNEYEEHYHSTKDGALKESLKKHIIPAFSIKQKQNEIFILDICYGLGFNTLATLNYHKKNNLKSKVYIYAPELDAELISSLKYFIYPKEFIWLKKIILKLSDEYVYCDDKFYIEIFVGDARKYIKKFKNKFDIVYQDAFSPNVNPALWTLEYFKDIKNTMKEDAVLTTYSTALKTRLALYENGFKVYLNSGDDFRNATISSNLKLDNFKLVDMEHKISCNQDIKPLSDMKDLLKME